LLVSKSNKCLKVDIIQSHPLVKGASEPEKLAKELKDIANYARNIIWQQA
jgi:hypothetical protein